MAAIRRAWTGWIIFAGVMLMVLGVLNICEGLVALFDDERLAIDAGNLVVIDVTGWGWALLGWGAVLLAVGMGLLARQGWARIAAIIVVGLHAVVQVTWLGAYPVWSLTMIALDTVVLFALTTRWSVVGERSDAYPATASGATVPDTNAPDADAPDTPAPHAPAHSPAVSRAGARHAAG